MKSHYFVSRYRTPKDAFDGSFSYHGDNSCFTYAIVCVTNIASSILTTRRMASADSRERTRVLVSFANDLQATASKITSLSPFESSCAAGVLLRYKLPT